MGVIQLNGKSACMLDGDLLHRVEARYTFRNLSTQSYTMSFVRKRGIPTWRSIPKIKIQRTNYANFWYQLIYYLKNLFTHRNKFRRFKATFKQYFNNTFFVRFKKRRCCEHYNKFYFLICNPRNRFAFIK